MDLQFNSVRKLRSKPSMRCASAPSRPPPTPFKSNRKSRRCVSLKLTRCVSTKQLKNASSFHVDGIINDGVNSTVYKIRKTSSQKSYSLKAIKRTMTKYCAKHYLSEIAIMQKLQTQYNATFYHSNIAKFRMFYVYEQKLHLISEIYPLGTLQRLLEAQQKRMNTKQIIVILAQLVEGLAYIHSKNIIHLDLKPENILCEKGANNVFLFKITDFGISVDIDACLSTQSALHLPSGDPIYIAPEILYQSLGHKFDMSQIQYLKNSDVFSLGIILIEMIQDIKLPSRGNVFEYLRNIKKGINHTIDWNQLQDNKPQFDCGRKSASAEMDSGEELLSNKLKQIALFMMYQNPQNRIPSAELQTCILQTYGALKDDLWNEFMKVNVPKEIDIYADKLSLTPIITYDADKMNENPFY